MGEVIDITKALPHPMLQLARRLRNRLVRVEYLSGEQDIARIADIQYQVSKLGFVTSNITLSLFIPLESASGGQATKIVAPNKISKMTLIYEFSRKTRST